MAEFKEVEQLLRSGKMEEYDDKTYNLYKKLIKYYNKSRVEQDFGFRLVDAGQEFTPEFIYNIFYLVAVTHDEEYFLKKAVLIEYMVSPFKARAFLYDVRGMRYIEINREKLKELKPKLTRKLSFRHPKKSIRKFFERIEKYVFTDTPPFN